MLADELLPVYDVSDEVATVVHAETPAVWQPLMNVDMIALGRRAPLDATALRGHVPFFGM